MKRAIVVTSAVIALLSGAAVVAPSASGACLGHCRISGIDTLAANPRKTVVAVTWLLDGNPICTSNVPSRGTAFSCDVNARVLPAGTHTISTQMVQTNGAQGRFGPPARVTVGPGPTSTANSPTVAHATVRLSGSQPGFRVANGTTVYGPATITGDVRLSPASRLEDVTVHGEIIADDAPGASVRDVTVRGVAGQDGMRISNSSDFSIQGSSFLGAGAKTSEKGIVDDGPSTSNLEIAYDSVSNFGGDGAYLITSGNHKRIVPGLNKILVLDSKWSGANGPYGNGEQARGFIVGGHDGYVIGNSTTGGTTAGIETYNDAVGMTFAYNHVSSTPVGFYLEHFADDSTFSHNTTSRVRVGFNVEWLAGSATTSASDRFTYNDVTYTGSGLFADAGTRHMTVGPGNMFRGPAPAVTYQGSTDGTIEENTACLTSSGPFAAVYSNDGFVPHGSVVVVDNLARRSAARRRC